MDKGDKSDNNFFMWPFTCLFVNLLNYLVKFQIIYKLDSILNVIIDKYTYWLDGHLDLKVQCNFYYVYKYKW